METNGLGTTRVGTTSPRALPPGPIPYRCSSTSSKTGNSAWPSTNTHYRIDMDTPEDIAKLSEEYGIELTWGQTH